MNHYTFNFVYWTYPTYMLILGTHKKSKVNTRTSERTSKPGCLLVAWACGSIRYQLDFLFVSLLYKCIDELYFCDKCIMYRFIFKLSKCVILLIKLQNEHSSSLFYIITNNNSPFLDNLPNLCFPQCLTKQCRWITLICQR